MSLGTLLPALTTTRSMPRCDARSEIARPGSPLSWTGGDDSCNQNGFREYGLCYYKNVIPVSLTYIRGLPAVTSEPQLTLAHR